MGDIPTGFAVGEFGRILLKEATRRGLEPHQNIYYTDLARSFVISGRWGSSLAPSKAQWQATRICQSAWRHISVCLKKREATGQAESDGFATAWPKANIWWRNRQGCVLVCYGWKIQFVLKLKWWEIRFNPCEKKDREDKTEVTTDQFAEAQVLEAIEV